MRAEYERRKIQLPSERGAQSGSVRAAITVGMIDGKNRGITIAAVKASATEVVNDGVLVSRNPRSSRSTRLGKAGSAFCIGIRQEYTACWTDLP